ncbi:hypothetical protein DFQ27_001774 [Actinomortierella ambigua]|uniref:Prolyl endopeptidase-like n=1 Tax=Actinomortierella ambigua TaxID=1343610 RepID=A0A9P6QB80_9FUNG|nr:hypothetical protein DFQ27_001774 [Actinomortierella ambigua]
MSFSGYSDNQSKNHSAGVRVLSHGSTLLPYTLRVPTARQRKAHCRWSPTIACLCLLGLFANFLPFISTTLSSSIPHARDAAKEGAQSSQSVLGLHTTPPASPSFGPNDPEEQDAVCYDSGASLTSIEHDAEPPKKQASEQSSGSIDTDSEDSTVFSTPSIDDIPLVPSPCKDRYESVPLPPRAKRIPRPLTLHGQTTIDNYHWMHEIEQDPDVTKYIRAETNYTTRWFENSHIKQLFDQIEHEQQSIKTSIAKLDYIRDETPAGLANPIVESETTFLFQSQDGKGRQTLAPRGQRLEGTQYWDVDTWRYWLDVSKGEYGVFLRRRVPLQPKQYEHEHSRLMLKQAATGTGDMSADFDLQAPLAIPAPEPPSKPIIQIVLDVNKLQRRRERQGMAGQFSFGMLEIQPRSTVLQPRDGNTSVSASLALPDTIMAAYSYDVTGNERYHIHIMSLAEDPRRDRNKARTMSEHAHGRQEDPPLPVSTHDGDDDEVDEEEVEEKAHHDYEHWGHPENPSIPGFQSFMLSNAGVGSRWARIGDSLFLYYTQVDPKGLQREVWRVCVQSIDPKSGQVVYDKLMPELVMREEDQRLFLGLTQTNDLQYLLIESTGQATSHTYFLDVHNPAANWTLVRQPEDGAVYSVEHHSGFFYIRTNRAGNENFEVIRVPVSAYKSNSIQQEIQSTYSTKFFGGDQPDEVVIPHSDDEFLERFEVFVDHFVAWIWREGMQEIRVFDALKALSAESSAPSKLPIKERQRLRPWRKETRVATVLPGCIRGEDDRLFRNYFATRLQYCNSSFIRPWGLYEYDMTAPPATYGLVFGEDDEKDNDTVINNATTLICQDPFPIGVVYGDPSDPCSQKASFMDSLTAMSASVDGSHISHQSEADPPVSGPEHVILEQRQSVNDVKTCSFPSGGSSRRKSRPSLYRRIRSSLPATTVISAAAEAQKPHPSDERKQQEKEMSKFTEKRLMVPSRHTPNVSIPVSLVYYDFHGRNFPRPAFVRAYGAYGTMTSGEFDPDTILPLLHRGLIYVQVHPRGDGVLGPRWYRDGRMENKTNTFYDVEDVLVHLKKSGMVTPGGCAIEGRSAGGLVSGWMANRWGETAADMEDGGDDDKYGLRSKGNIVHEMVKVVLAQVPFLDVIAGMADKDIPWVEYEWTEWGNPIESAAIYETMKKYSPYDRIRTQPYPAMMIMGGLSDSRVSYAEPLKYVAKLRSVDGKTNDCQDRKHKKKKKKKEERSTTPANGLAWGFDVSSDGYVEEDEKDDKPERSINNKMCDGQSETPLLLDIEDGGHFAGSSAKWIAFALVELGATKVETPQS